MDEQEQGRLTVLSQGELVPVDYVDGYYGLRWPFDGELGEDYAVWKGGLRRSRAYSEGMVSRHELESFMQAKNVVSKKWMAARLGMDVPSFDSLAERLGELGLRPSRYLPYDQMVAENLSEDIVASLPGLRFRTFSDHNSFCQRVHADLDQVLALTVRPLFCATSAFLQEYPRQFGNVFDCVTWKALSTKHAVWLDFRKPLTLGPDRCSKLFYAHNRDQLQQFCAGISEPHDIDSYLAFVSETGDAG